jgi:ATP phosphoribosyltransferase regulatory subunit
MPRLPTIHGRPAARGRAGGFTDWLPGAAERRRAICDAFVDAFALWGYGLVATPLLEPVETIAAAGVGVAHQSQLFRFMDSDGSLLALVGERTISVGRVVATQLYQGPFPMRLCYAGPVLKNQPLLGGRRRETMHAGVELIGHAGIEADAEVIALAAEAVDRAGIEGVQIDVGHADFVPGLLAGAGLGFDGQHRVLDALSARNLVAVESALEGTDVGEAERSLLLRFPTLRGGREILDAAGSRLTDERARHSLSELADLWERLAAYGLENRVHLDLGAVRDWAYYTGPTFELFSGDLGFPLGAGGRYDALLGRLGASAPATGFVLHVDRCHDVVLRRGAGGARRSVVHVTHTGEHGDAALGVARSLRGAGVAASCTLVREAEVAAPYVRVDGLNAEWSDGSAVRSGTVGEAVTQLAAALA